MRQLNYHIFDCAQSLYGQVNTSDKIHVKHQTQWSRPEMQYRRSYQHFVGAETPALRLSV